MGTSPVLAHLWPPPVLVRTLSGKNPQEGVLPLMTVLQAAESGYKDLLVTLRNLIARTIDDGCSPRDLVGLSRRLLDLAAEVRELESRPSLRLVPDEAFDPAVI